MYKLKVIERYFRNHLGAISFSTHLRSTCRVTSYVNIREVNPKTTCLTVRGHAKSRNAEELKASAAGTKEYSIWYLILKSSSSVSAVS